MPRRVSVDLDLDASKYMSEARSIAVATKVVDEEMKGLGKETDKVGRDMDELALAAEAAKKGLGGVGTKATETKTELSSLQARIEATKASIHDMNVEWAKTGDDALRSKIRKETGLLRDLEKAAKDVAGVVGPSLDFGLSSLLPGNSSGSGNFSLASLMPKNLVKLGASTATDGFALGDMVMPALIGAVAAASPAIGAMVSGAVVGGIGLGGIAGGIVAASKDPRVKSAWSDFAGSLSSTDFGSAAFADPTIKAIGILKSSLSDLHLSTVLGQGAAGVPVLAQGIADLVKNAMPGFNSIMSHATDIAHIFANGLGDIGGALGSAMTDLMNTDGTLEGLQVILTGTADTIRFTGHVVGDLAGAFDGLARVAEPLSEAMLKVWGGVPIIGGALREVQKQSEAATGTGADMVYTLHAISTEAINAAHGIGPFSSGLMFARQNVDDLTKSIEELFRTQMTADQAAMGWEASLDALSASIKENGRSLDIGTDKGRTNRQAILDGVEAADRQRQANIAGGMSAGEAAIRYQQQIEKLEALAAHLGVSKAALDKIVGNYQITITTTERHNIVELHSEDYRQYGGARAAGGPVTAGLSYIVGDGGRPELFTPAQDGYISPSVPASPAGMGSWQSASSMGGAALPPVNLTVNLVDSITGQTVRTMLITDALNRNQDNSRVSAAYP